MSDDVLEGKLPAGRDGSPGDTIHRLLPLLASAPLFTFPLVSAVRVDFLLQKRFWVWRQENAPIDRAPQFERMGFWGIVLGISGQYLLGKSHRAFPPGPIAQGLGHFFRESPAKPHCLVLPSLNSGQ
ncbi:hypothetical protein MPNT_10047 [Candidatus Methylacidithermus pantelleriae]|uniref:Uncharacterized protein n=1 Tax=Candidatus Methylacidithermus pantelleriae TaxID=2744239 RepID=A0A8J2FUT2_9BACT|nr:hypothetical protein MPNT_10047 [Candidatus Methylacidithermus pantelleriae]